MPLRCAAVVLLLCCAALVALCTAETRICLNMIAKNEKKDLPKCLEAFGPELSGWTLCDTGSTDGTPQIAQEYFKKHKVPGSVVYHKWTNSFAANRNQCIEAAVKWSRAEAKKRKMAKGSHFCDYLLFLDADHFLNLPDGAKPGDFKAMNLTEDVYMMTEKNYVTYKNVRLGSTRLEWEWVGEVHEFVRRADGGGLPSPRPLVEGYWLKHDASGGPGGKRFVRDEEVLTQAVAERPQDARARFYLGNTLRTLRKHPEAIAQYIERIKLRGWSEERYMAALNAAHSAKALWDLGDRVPDTLKEHLANWDTGAHQPDPAGDAKEQAAIDAARAAYFAAKAALNATSAGSAAAAAASKGSGNATGADASGGDAAAQEQLKAQEDLLNSLLAARRAREVPWVLAAYHAASQILPYRPEAWVHLAKVYRMHLKDYERCYSYATTAYTQGEPRPDTLFLDTHAARYHALDEMCVCGYWVGARVWDQAKTRCRQVEARLVGDLAEVPNAGLQKILERTRANLAWFHWKDCTAQAATNASMTCPQPK